MIRLSLLFSILFLLASCKPKPTIQETGLKANSNTYKKSALYAIAGSGVKFDDPNPSVVRQIWNLWAGLDISSYRYFQNGVSKEAPLSKIHAYRLLGQICKDYKENNVTELYFAAFSRGVFIATKVIHELQRYECTRNNVNVRWVGLIDGVDTYMDVSEIFSAQSLGSNTTSSTPGESTGLYNHLSRNIGIMGIGAIIMNIRDAHWPRSLPEGTKGLHIIKELPGEHVLTTADLENVKEVVHPDKKIRHKAMGWDKETYKLLKESLLVDGLGGKIIMASDL